LNSDDGTQIGELPNPSNVTRLSRAIKPESEDGIQQVVYYHYGVGTQGGVLDRVVMGTCFPTSLLTKGSLMSSELYPD
jgi:uncharacterized protein (DUF2235 family)